MDIISRSQAFRSGSKRYFTGKPCKHGHLTERYTRNAICLECARINNTEGPALRILVHEEMQRRKLLAAGDLAAYTEWELKLALSKASEAAYKKGEAKRRELREQLRQSQRYGLEDAPKRSHKRNGGITLDEFGNQL